MTLPAESNSTSNNSQLNFEFKAKETHQVAANTQSATTISLSEALRRLLPSLADSASTNTDNLNNYLFISLFVATNLVIFSFLTSTVPYLQTVEVSLRYFFGGMFTLAAAGLIAFTCREFFKTALSQLKSRNVGVDFCVALALSAVSVFLFYSLFFKTAYLPLQTTAQSAVYLLAVILLAKKIESFFFSDIYASCIYDLPVLAPTANMHSNSLQGDLDEASIAENKILKPQLARVPSSQLKIGDVLHVTDGELVPCDSTVLAGQAQVAEPKYCGLTESRHKDKGDNIYAGALVVKGSLDLKVTALPEDSMLTYFTTILNQKLADTFVADTERHNISVTFINVLICCLAVSSSVYWIAGRGDVLIAYSVFCSVLLVTALPKMLQLQEFLKPFAEVQAFRKGALSVGSFVIEKLNGLKNFIIDYTFQNPPGMSKVKNLEVVDTRIEDKSLRSVIFALSGRAEGEIFAEINRFVAEESGELEILAVTDFAEYRGDGNVVGICGRISGVDISLGNEDFLLERGVIMQESELVSEPQSSEVMYVALNDDLIARLNVLHPFSAEVSDALREIKSCGLRTVLCSSDAGQNLDEVGKRAGLELPDVFGGLNNDTFHKKVSAYKPCAMLCSDATSSEIIKSTDASLAIFDDILWDLKKADISVFSRQVSVLADLFRVSKNYHSVKQQNFLLVCLLSALLFTLAVLGAITPLVSALTVLLVTYAILLNTYRIER